MPPWQILLVEDESEIRTVVSEYLEALGYDVDAVSSGKEAIECIGDALRSYDIALVDWNMPGISGRDVVQDLLRRRPGTAVLVITGKVEPVTLPGGALADVGLLPKPFSLRDLARAIEARMATRTDGSA